MALRTLLPDAFHHLVLNDNFHWHTPFKNTKFDLFGSEKCQLVVNRDWLIVIVQQATAYIFRQFWAITTAWQRTYVVGLYRLQLFYFYVSYSRYVFLRFLMFFFIFTFLF